MSNRVNEKTFTLINRVSKTFSVVIANFAFATTLLFRIRDRIRITFISKATLKAVSVINLRKIKLVISQMKLIVKPTQTISLRTVKLITVFRQTMKAVTTITLRIPITFIFRSIQKLNTTILIKKIVLTMTPILATFFTLGDYDPDTLLTMDSQTLGQLDYTT